MRVVFVLFLDLLAGLLRIAVYSSAVPLCRRMHVNVAKFNLVLIHRVHSSASPDFRFPGLRAAPVLCRQPQSVRRLLPGV